MQTQIVVAQAERLMDSFLADLQTIVNIDSGTYTKPGIDRVVAYLQQRFHDFGFTTTIDEQQERGNNIIATHAEKNAQGPRILLIGHTDTVFSEGEAERRPFTISERDGKQIATGPGILDMKSGLLIGMYGLHLLIQSGPVPYQSVTFICNSDEEIGSFASRDLIEAYARQSDAVIVLEPGRNVNYVVSARRGTGHYRVEVRGRASHAGVDPQTGRSAILELSHKVIALQGLNGTIPGTTLNVGFIHGGERLNVVPDYAYCGIDVRASTREGARAIEEAMRGIVAQTVVDGTSSTLSGAVRSDPFERTEGSARLVQLAKNAGKELGLSVEDISSGGASDANGTANIVPTIDGLGAAGGLAHNEGEYIELDSLPTRIALLAGLIRQIGM